MSQDSYSVAIIGASGYTGQELLRYLQFHPLFQLNAISSDVHTGKKLGDVHPSMQKAFPDVVFSSHGEAAEAQADLFFLATPNEVSLELVPFLLDRGKKVVDLSGSYRLSDKKNFQKYYKLDHPSDELIRKRVYGIPEINGDKIARSNFISNPGCYPTGVLLALYGIREILPLLASPVMIDAKSGTSGAGGRVSAPGFGYVDVNENFKAYKILNHQHEPEMWEHLHAFTGHNVELHFVPHLLPMTRGILSTIWLYFRESVDESALRRMISESYAGQPFVRLLAPGENAMTANVSYTNQCHLQVTVDENRRIAVLTAVIDNLGKGAAGQAIQNANLMFGIAEDFGLC